MKLFHTENEKEVVYVQMQDIMYLLEEVEIEIPTSIFTKIFNKTVIVDNSNRFDFVKFDNEHEVKFFKELEYIIDYDQYKDFTDKQLDEEGNKFAKKANDIAKKWNCMTKEEQKQNISLYHEYNNIMYIMNFISEIYAVKRGKRSMPFPDFVKLPKKENVK